MKKKVHNFKTTITTLNGGVYTGEEFLANPPIFSYEANKKMIDDFAYAVSPYYRKAEKARRHFERVEARKKELAEMQSRINEELEKL